LKGAKEGLITFSIDLPAEAYRKIFEQVKKLYVSEQNSAWDEERERILSMLPFLFFSFLFNDCYFCYSFLFYFAHFFLFHLNHLLNLFVLIA
jgi:hypothetical protein